MTKPAKKVRRRTKGAGASASDAVGASGSGAGAGASAAADAPINWDEELLSSPEPAESTVANPPTPEDCQVADIGDIQTV